VLTCTAEPTCLEGEGELSRAQSASVWFTGQNEAATSWPELTLRVTLSSSISSILSLPTQIRKFDLFDPIPHHSNA
jgi:hypothetical protein